MLTTSELSKLLGVSCRRTLALAEARGEPPARVIGRAKLWHPSAVRRLRPGKPGRPPLRK